MRKSRFALEQPDKSYSLPFFDFITLTETTCGVGNRSRPAIHGFAQNFLWLKPSVHCPTFSCNGAARKILSEVSVKNLRHVLSVVGEKLSDEEWRELQKENKTDDTANS